MYSLANYRSWPLGAALALAAACGTEQFQLEPMHAALTVDDPIVATWDEGATCLSVEVMVEQTYEARLNGRPIHIEGLDEWSLTGGVTHFLCVPSGAYELSLLENGRSIAHSGTLSMRPGGQMMVLIYGAADAPSLNVAEVDLSDPGDGLRRVRITNLIADGQPVQLVYYDDQDVELGRSELVAHGDTWTGAISSAITSWRVDPTQNPAFSFSYGFGSWEYMCLESPAAGLVLTRRPEVGSPDPYGPYPGAYRQEIYTQPPPVCTIDPRYCPDCAKDRVPWPASCSTPPGGPTVCTATY